MFFFMQYEWTYNMYLERPKEYIERQIKKNSMAIREAAKNITAFFFSGPATKRGAGWGVRAWPLRKKTVF